MKPDPDPTDPAPGMHIWGWMSPAELYWLHDTAVTMSSVAEIGCLHGRSAWALLKGCPGPVYCIDRWNDDHRKSFPSFMNNCGRFANLRAWQTTSVEAARGWPGRAWYDQLDQVDMTFIDGSHAYESVLIDIASWLPLTRKLICGHDYANADDGFPGVRKAVTEVFGAAWDGRVTIPDGTSIWVVDLTADRTVPPGLPTEFDFTDEYENHYVETVTW